LSDNPRVRISFHVGLGEVPKRISSLMKEVEAVLDTEAHILGQSAGDLIVKGNIKEISDAIDHARVALMGADLCLQDCHELLSSYQAAQLELMQQDDEEPLSEE
jgi:hypothetical protein